MGGLDKGEVGMWKSNCVGIWVAGMRIQGTHELTAPGDSRWCSCAYLHNHHYPLQERTQKPEEPCALTCPCSLGREGRRAAAPQPTTPCQDVCAILKVVQELLLSWAGCCRSK